MIQGLMDAPGAGGVEKTIVSTSTPVLNATWTALSSTFIPTYGAAILEIINKVAKGSDNISKVEFYILLSRVLAGTDSIREFIYSGQSVIDRTHAITVGAGVTSLIAAGGITPFLCNPYGFTFFQPWIKITAGAGVNPPTVTSSYVRYLES